MKRFMDGDRKTTAFTAFTTGDIGALNAHFHVAAERGILPLVAQNFRMQRFDTCPYRKCHPVGEERRIG
jgi:hypothetical protein